MMIATDPAALIKYLDEPRALCVRSAPLYNPHASWDGLSVDPRPFSRLDTFQRPLGTAKKQSGLAGSRIVELEAAPVGGAMCFGRAARGPPLPKDERWAGAEATAEKFENLRVVSPRVQPAGARVDGALAPPALRRDALFSEVARNRAKALQRKVEGERRRAFDVMRYRYPDGVLGFDSTANPESEVYGQVAKQKAAEQERRDACADRRRRFLSTRSVATESHGFNPLKHDHVHQEKFLQSRACHPPYADTASRVFQKREVVFKPERAQQLREYDLNGKQYNIVTHTTIEVLPSKIAETVNRRLIHPSQQSLERGRNLQGSLLLPPPGGDDSITNFLA